MEPTCRIDGARCQHVEFGVRVLTSTEQASESKVLERKSGGLCVWVAGGGGSLFGLCPVAALRACDVVASV